jgi:hypothetical protein
MPKYTATIIEILENEEEKVTKECFDAVTYRDALSITEENVKQFFPNSVSWSVEKD